MKDVWLSSCDLLTAPKETPVEASAAIREEALNSAVEYIGTPNVWGGQSGDGIDCSGLVIKAYEKAVEITAYQLLFDDTTVTYLFRDFSTEVKNPKRGDLIFMGEENITHVAMFVEMKAGRVYFFDAFSTTGEVNKRSYLVDNYKITMYKRLLLGEVR